MQVKDSKGFTLAEVLITIGIIGVVASLTVPALISNIQKFKYVSGLKKELSLVQQAVLKYIVDQGSTTFSQTLLMSQDPNNFYEYSSSKQALMASFVSNYIKTVKTCNVGDTSCNYPQHYLNGIADDYEWSSNDFGTNTGMIMFLADGASVGFYPLDELNCETLNLCWIVDIDVNGKTPPNVSGRDMYFFAIDNNGMIYPQYGKKDDQYPGSGYWRDSPDPCGDPNLNTISGAVYGTGCAARIIEEGWQMNY